MLKKDNVTIIAEAGVNHDGQIDKAVALVDAAAQAGADFVKFQTFRAEKLVSKDAPKADYQIQNTGSQESQFEMLKRLELSDNDHQKLIEHCKTKNIKFLSTPFDIEALHMLVEHFDLPLIKLGSSELTNGPILLAAAQTGRPVIFSTGMGSLAEIEEALAVLAFGYLNPNDTPTTRADFAQTFKTPAAQKALHKYVTILHCNTAYPTPFEDVNLRAMQTIAEHFDVPVGYSDHTLGIEASVAAVAMGASVIEKHFTLDKTADGPDHKASLEPDELTQLISSIRNIEKALGNPEKTPTPSEQANAYMARKSLFAAQDIMKGAVFNTQNTTIKRPANGASPMEYWDILDTQATQDYQADSPLKGGEQ